LAQTLLAVDVGTPGIDRDGSGGLQSAQWTPLENLTYPLVNIQKTMENQHFSRERLSAGFFQ